MRQRRIVYKGCLVESAWETPDEIHQEEHDQRSHYSGRYRLFEPQLIGDLTESPRTQAIKELMADALRLLSEEEREFIERHYYAGQTYEVIGHEMEKSRRRLEATHRRAIRQLRKLLRPFAEEYFAGTLAPEPECLICRSPRRAEIERLIASRDPRQPWGTLMRKIKSQFSLEVTSSMVLIGHMKYH